MRRRRLVDDDARAAMTTRPIDARVRALAQTPVGAGRAVAAERSRRHVDADGVGADTRRRVAGVQLLAPVAVVARRARAPAP